MQKIIDGFRRFHSQVFPKQREEFERLAKKQQKPLALFVTCADSRIDPNLITQTEPGDIFTIRNVGNLVAPWGSDNSSEAAAIEYALEVLGIRNIVVCGHSHCGAMQAMLETDSVWTNPALRNWFNKTEATRSIVRSKYATLNGADLLDSAVKENILQQLTHLRTHPAVAGREAQGQIKLFGWFYQIESGEILAYRPSLGVFDPLSNNVSEDEYNLALSPSKLLSHRLPVASSNGSNGNGGAMQ